MSPRIGRFELNALVASNGSGGGVLWRARDTESGADVALKVLAAPAPQGAALDSGIARAYARLAKQPDSGWVPIVAIGATEIDPEVFADRAAPVGRHGYCAMQWIEGPDLTATIEAGPLAAESAARLMATIAHRLAIGHAAGVAHLGLKPTSIKLTPSGPVLLDCRSVWGDLGDRRSGGRAMTAATCLAPEQKAAPKGAAAVDEDAPEPGPRSDVYALGVLLAALATGSLLPSDEALAEVDAPLAVIFHRAMARDPEARYASAFGLASALDAYLAPEASGTPTARHPGPRRLAARAGAVLLASLAALVLWQLAKQPDDESGNRNDQTTSPEGSQLVGETSGGRPTAASIEALDAPDFSAIRPTEPENANTPQALAQAEQLGRQADLALSTFSFHPVDLELLRATHGDLAVQIAQLVLRFGAQSGAPFDSERRRFLELFRPLPVDPQLDDPWLAFELEHAQSPRDRTLLRANALLETEPQPTTESATDRLVEAMRALRHSEPERARAALDGLPRDAAPLLTQVMRFQTRGQQFQDEERAEFTQLAERYTVLNVEAGILALDLGDNAAALEHFDRALERYPNHASARHHRAIALWRLDRKQEALAVVSALRQAAPTATAEEALPWSHRSSASYLFAGDQSLFSDPAMLSLIEAPR